MSTEGILASAVILVFGLAWLGYPLLRRRFTVGTDEVARQKERETLLTAYERTLAAIRDLDEDNLTGKLGPTDYEADRAFWTQQGVTLLQTLDAAGIQKPERPSRTQLRSKAVPVAEANPDAELDDAIEQAIANYIQSKQ